MILDFHTHAFPERIAARTMRGLEETAGERAFGNGTLENLRVRGAACGITHSVLLNIAVSPKSKSVKRINDFALEALTEPGIIPFGSLHPDMEDMEGELVRLKEAGIVGIKLHPCYQGFDIDDVRVYPLYELLCANDMIVSFHAGLDPLDMEHNFASPEASLKVHRQFPDMKMVLAHLGGAYQTDDAEQVLWGEEIYLDLALVGGYVPKEQFMKLLSKHPQEMILYGSDYPWHDNQELDMLTSFSLTDEQMERILYTNGMSLLGGYLR